MSCSPFDLRDYVLKELSEPETKQVDAHVRGCAACREEAERLRLTEAALFALRDEEIPQRIAFVSDKIFEPSPWRRAWAGFWGSTARLGFASAAMLSVALIVFSLARPAGVPLLATRAPATVRVTPAAASVSPAVSDAEIQQRIQAAVDQAVSASEARLTQSFDERVKTMQQQFAARLMAAADDLGWEQRQARLITRASYGPPSAGDSK